MAAPRREKSKKVHGTWNQAPARALSDQQASWFPPTPGLSVEKPPPPGGFSLFRPAATFCSSLGRTACAAPLRGQCLPTSQDGFALRERRLMSLTPDLVALCARPEVDPGPDPAWTRLDDDGYAALADASSQRAARSPLWVFAYGSLIWKPVFEAVEKRRGTAYGWHRSFCLEIKAWRGSPAQPGLMMALDRGGRCDGVVYPDARTGSPRPDRGHAAARGRRRRGYRHDPLASRRDGGRARARRWSSGPDRRDAALRASCRRKRSPGCWRAPAAMSAPAPNISTTP